MRGRPAVLPTPTSAHPTPRVRSRGLRQKLPPRVWTRRGASWDPQRSSGPPPCPGSRCRAGAERPPLVQPGLRHHCRPHQVRPQEGPSAGSLVRSPLSSDRFGTRRGVETTARSETSPAGWRPLRETGSTESTATCTPLSHGDDRTVKRLVVTRNKPGSGSPRPPRVPAGGRVDRARWSSRLRSITARSCEAEPAKREGPVGDGVGSRGDQPQLPEPRPEDTHGPTETCVPREACDRLRAGVVTGGRPCGPLCWADTQSSPREEGVSTDRARRHREPPSVGVLGALPTPQLLDASPHMGLSEDGSQACWEDPSLHNRMAPSVAEAPRALA